MQKPGFRLFLGATVVVVAAATLALARGERGLSPAVAGARALPDLAHLGDLARVAEMTASMSGSRATTGSRPSDRAKLMRTRLADPVEPAKG